VSECVSDFDNFDDLDAVRDFRNLATPFPGAVDTAVRRRIFELADARGYRPLPAPPEPGPGANGFRYEAVAERAPAAGGGGPTVLLELRGIVRTGIGRRYPFMVAVAVLLVLGLTAGLLARRAGPGETVDVGEATELDRSAPPAPPAVLSVPALEALVAAQPDTILAPGTFEHRKVERGRTAGVVRGSGPVGKALVEEVTERWAAADHTGKLQAQPKGPAPIGGPPADERPLPPATAFDGRSYDALRSLPADVAALPARLVAEPSTSGGDEGGIIATAFDDLATSVVRPEVRAALVRLLGGRGLAAVGARSDRAGRQGQGFTLVDASGSWTLVVDGRSGDVLGWEQRHDPAGAVIAYLLVLETTIGAEGPGR
jgi:hypothetical protein